MPPTSPRRRATAGIRRPKVAGRATDRPTDETGERPDATPAGAVVVDERTRTRPPGNPVPDDRPDPPQAPARPAGTDAGPPAVAARAAPAPAGGRGGAPPATPPAA
ncbi:MAG: hypothetical protein OJJ54_03370, partial [Pseudonocardia sp.]|nr:hypothetical protein [Pseudonocardia sp.]